MPSNQSSAAAPSPHDWLRSVPLRVSSPRRSRGRGKWVESVGGKEGGAAGGAHLGTAQFQHQSVGHKLNVAFHELTVHPDQVDRESFSQELLRRRRCQVTTSQQKH